VPPFASVSVVIPARNARRYIRQAIISVFAQTLPVSELIIVDDGSTDGTLVEAKRTIETLRYHAARRRRRQGRAPSWTHIKTLLLSQHNKGVSAARNIGIRAAACDWIAFLDADDTWDPRKIELQQELAGRWPTAHLITCDRRILEGEQIIADSYLAALGHPQRSLSNVLIDELGCVFPVIGADYLERGWVILPSTVMVRRWLFCSVGLFDEYMGGMEDWECFMRILARYSIALVETPLANYRLHENNTHRNHSLMEAGHRRYVELVVANPERYPPGALIAARGFLGRPAAYDTDLK
jgi:glycosyltransferase involved in cell wall biosynthesis